MQIGAAIGQVQLSLNGFVETFPRIAERRIAVARVVVFRDVIGELDALIANASQLTLAITEWVPDRLARQLDKEERWDRILSLGEQQRLAFVRLLLHRPRWIFMDEATAALDEADQDGHRPGPEALHTRTLQLLRAEGGARLTRKTPRWV
ncbi:MAG: hypothetical protein NTY94_11760 [Alphaproteobacteria bacterium]|nr:hypothetical protein [Alphaproteobacteria bacterium]